MSKAPASAMLAALLLLAGCGGRDPVDAPVNWWHQLEGGEIARQRPPPPGVDAPYPLVGTTPSKPPAMLSPDLRAALTQHLEEQRNLSARLNADDPIAALPPTPPAATAKPAPATGPAPSAAVASAPGQKPEPGGGTSPAAANAPAASSATLDAVEAPPAPAASQPVLAMPDVVPDRAGLGEQSGPIPPIPAAPPGSPDLPGFPVLAAPTYAAQIHPNYALADRSGERLLFPDGSDALSPGQDGILRSLVAHRGKTGTIFVHGYGDAASDAPADQAQALTLGALRARAVAAWLQANGVPAGAIRIRADAFGRGATAGLVD
ncbi:OmpA family protein [Acetobacteraceae bacterium KSS8]|uniref:OmpA family protein n=1 Tax=Endosaccharibacter trunci TaxID=2812733 RepID=A0ABT1W878_9PROT|nr:OmpA family protein [Acetobacteraceae bacterium KSS8]